MASAGTGTTAPNGSKLPRRGTFEGTIQKWREDQRVFGPDVVEAAFGGGGRAPQADDRLPARQRVRDIGGAYTDPQRSGARRDRSDAVREPHPFGRGGGCDREIKAIEAIEGVAELASEMAAKGSAPAGKKRTLRRSSRRWRRVSGLKINAWQQPLSPLQPDCDS